MIKKLLKFSKTFNPGDRIVSEVEPSIEDLKFTIHKFSNKPKPTDPKRHLIFPCFSELGSECIGSFFLISRIAQKFPSHYKTVVGWYGREYLYRHLVDEFWELDESFMWLREYSRAFHHESVNLKKFENKLKDDGIVVSSNTMGRIALGTQCNSCFRYWAETTRIEKCAFCDSKDIRRSLYSDIDEAKKTICLPPKPSKEKMSFAMSLVGKKPVGVFARARKCYGRNLPSEFYIKLISKLEELGYNPIWLGEKSTTLPCPIEHIFDFSRTEEARDLETTLAIVSLCNFTVQFWTASTRLAALVKTPYLLFESPDQLWDHGQEGYRLDLVTTGKRKIVASHYLNVLNDMDGGINLVEKCIKEMEANNYNDVIGMIENTNIVKAQRQNFKQKQSMKAL